MSWNKKVASHQFVLLQDVASFGNDKLIIAGRSHISCSTI